MNAWQKRMKYKRATRALHRKYGVQGRKMTTLWLDETRPKSIIDSISLRNGIGYIGGKQYIVT